MISQLKHRPTVLLTRPQADAEVFAAELESIGVAAALDPIMKIEMEKPLNPDLSKFQALLVTSANAAEALKHLTDIRDIPLIIVGDESAAISRSIGFKDVRKGGRTAVQMCGWIKKNLQPSDGPLLYASGVDVSVDLAAELPSFDLVREIVYKSVLSAKLSDETVAALSDGQIDAVVHFSARSAVHFASLCAEADIIPAMKSVLAYCISENVARAASESIDWRELRVAESPSRGDILDIIASDLKRGRLQ